MTALTRCLKFNQLLQVLQRKPTFSNVVISTSNGGSTANGVSSLESADTFSSQATFKVLGVSRDPKNNEIGSANVNWRVMIDEHLLGSGTAGAG